MNWEMVRFDWNQVRAFLVTAEEGTLSSAARALGLTQPTLGRQVAALEDSLGVVLFERVGRSLHLTEAGTALLAHVRQMGDAAHRVSLVAASQSGAVAGDVRLSASEGLCSYILPELIGGLREVAPDITLQIIAESRISDLMRREADIAIRHVAPQEPDLIGRRLKDGVARLYASRSWVDRYGVPNSLAELAQRPFLGQDHPDRVVSELRRFGIELPGLTIPIRCENSSVVWEMAKAGHGMAFMSVNVAEKSPDMVQLDVPGFPELRFPIWLITHRELRTAQRIRVVFDFLANALSAEL